MRICLVIPPSIFLLDERVFMNLGILRVAAVLERAGVEIEMLDLSGIENYEEVAALHAQNSKASLFALTSTTPQMPASTKIVWAMRKVRPSAKFLLGGPHITLVNAAYRKEMKKGIQGRAVAAFERCKEIFDILIAGDGEEAIFIVLENPSVSFIDADDPATPLFLTNSKLNELPFPARHLVDVSTYHYSIDGVPALSIIAQLGCPFGCGFCGGRESPMLRRVRTRTSENVVKEIVEMHRRYNINGFMFYDDELNVNPKMVELMNLIQKTQEDLRVEFRLRGFIKSQLFTDEQARAMYRAGFRWILVGFESGSSKILKNINKQATCDENTRCIEIAKRHGLKVKALMSVGHPGESRETILDTHRWLLETKPDDFDVTVITTYPGTPYYDYAQKYASKEKIWVYTCPENGDKLYSEEVDYTLIADYYKGDPNGGYKSFVYTEALSPKALVELRDFVERDVREKLEIPFNPSGTSLRYEHSMGQAGLPLSILRTTGKPQISSSRLD